MARTADRRAPGQQKGIENILPHQRKGNLPEEPASERKNSSTEENPVQSEKHRVGDEVILPKRKADLKEPPTIGKRYY